MTTLNFTRILILTAATIGASALYAQPKLNANVPFAFTAGKGVMPAGAYEVSIIPTNGSGGSVKLVHIASRRTVLAITSGSGASADSSLAFRCAANACALTEVALGPGRAAYAVPAATPKADDREVLMTRVRLMPAGL